MKRSDISDIQVVACAASYQSQTPVSSFVTDLIVEETGAPYKVAEAAMERALDHGLIEYGVSLRTAWPTREGMALLHPGHDPDCQMLRRVPPGFPFDTFSCNCPGPNRADTP